MSDPDHATEGPPACAVGLTPRQTHCANCGTGLMGPYCYRCGQSTKHTLKHLPALAADATDAVFNIDGRIMRSLPALYLRPGFLAREYFAGRRMRYVPPFRLMFFMSVLAFLLIHLGLMLHPVLPNVRQVSNDGASVQFSGDARDVRTPKAAEPGSTTETDAPAGTGEVHFDQVHLGWLPDFANTRINDGIRQAEINVHELVHGSKPVRSEAWRRVARNFLSVAPPTLFVLMPVVALLLQLMYLFKRRLYIEHLIVTLYSHAFIFLSLFMAVALKLIQSTLPAWAGAPIDWLMAGVWIWVFVYLLVMQKRIYAQGWFVTVVKYCFTGACYSILLFVALIIALFIGLAR